MSIALNGKIFKVREVQLKAAALKLSRAVKNNENFDPQSGFSIDEIINFIVNLPCLGNEEQLAKAKAVLRRNDFSEIADSFAV